MMKYKYGIWICMLLCIIPSPGVANTTYDTEGTDILIVGKTLTDYAYEILIMLMTFMCIVSGAYVLKDSRPSGGMDGSKHGSTGIKIFQGIVVCLIILVCGPFIINMIL